VVIVIGVFVRDEHLFEIGSKLPELRLVQLEEVGMQDIEERELPFKLRLEKRKTLLLEIK
jgi:hypothetical protein